jgi:prefoldin subunit 5|tara:strand:+ start:185 stop:412 length:228 start_codon:yes stop_codon:yes gene_type:complete
MTITLSAVYIILASLSVLGGAIALWVKMQNELTRLKSRVHYLETNDNELKAMLADVLSRLQHIELLLASNQIKRK